MSRVSNELKQSQKANELEYTYEQIARNNLHNMKNALNQEIDKPKHYASKSGKDVIDWCEDFGIMHNAYVFNIFKYLCRAGKKDNNSELQDAMKAEVYLKRYIESLKKWTMMSSCTKDMKLSVENTYLDTSALKKMKNVLVTGNLGFIGFNFCQLMKMKFPDINVFGLDNETYAAQFMIDQKKDWIASNDIMQFRCDINRAYDCSLANEYVKTNNIDTIVHFAAESHVDNSIKNPNAFFETNVLGTANLLNIAKENDIRIHVIGTDEVYGITYPNSDAHENYPLCPSSPYSASKASSDLIAISYFRTFGTKVTVSRCTNNFGPWQHYEKLIPTVISKALRNEKIPVYGDGLQKRHWIHVDEHNEAVLKILESGEFGQIYNIAPLPENYISNIEIIKFILDELGKPYSLIEHVTDRLGHDTSYFLKDDKFQSRFGNASKTLWKDRMKDTIKWYAEHYATT